MLLTLGLISTSSVLSTWRLGRAPHRSESACRAGFPRGAGVGPCDVFVAPGGVFCKEDEALHMGFPLYMVQRMVLISDDHVPSFHRFLV